MQEGSLSKIIWVLLLSFALGSCVHNGKVKTKPQKEQYTPENALIEGLNNYYVGNFDLSYRLLNRVDEEFNRSSESENILTKSIKLIVTTLINDKVVEYKPWYYERSLINTFKGVDLLLENKLEKSRVEFNRAQVREEESAQEFKEEINKQQEEALKQIENNKKAKQEITKSTLERGVNYIISQYKTSLTLFKAYRDFQNPFINYIYGVYLENVGDFQKATNQLKKCLGMVQGDEPADKIVSRDLTFSAEEQSKPFPSTPKRTVWVFLFNGRIGERVEKRIDLPLFLVSKKVIYTGLALPDIKPGEVAVPYVVVETPSRSMRTKRLVDLDRLQFTEFRKRLPTIALKATVKAALYTVLQAKTKSEILKLVEAFTQYATNQADTRQWKNLPKEIQVLRVELTDSERELKVERPDGTVMCTVTPKGSENYLVFVNIGTPQDPGTCFTKVIGGRDDEKSIPSPAVYSSK
ncbi:hypothetical protein Theam_1169 [Thermovibrio ammonificans HB-1]|uniref:Uncharacterized protein n=1 Tax=Thermovibrio ammonificans (strain DSM 15698 / JCM 12110 / HB-1) TaxID=648996 RepID=E8T2N8_THEA1|nr:hypothetical protein [Thermovibrio ammonificans]ADU97133.1 hypothetical protein Theam_1169 [Thermovibrio ammonificans HB-1]